MARIAEPGISYYPMNVNHIVHSKIKLLFSEFGSDGYWIWSCILDRIYEDKGYYMSLSDKDEFELFAIDVCKKQVALVKEVIAGCLRRGLFDKTVFEVFNVLTSDRIQTNYLEATLARRKKDSVIELKADYLVINLDENCKNVVITGKKEIPPGNNSIPPGRNPQSIVEYSKEEKSKVNIPRERADEFEFFWNLYDKKVGDIVKIKKKWDKLSEEDQQKIFEFIPKYIEAQPDKLYRKNPESFLNNKAWNDELVPAKNFEKNGSGRGEKISGSKKSAGALDLLEEIRADFNADTGRE